MEISQKFVAFLEYMNFNTYYEIRVFWKYDIRLLLTWLKFIFSKEPTKIAEILTIDLKFTTLCQINYEDFIIFFGLLRKHEL